MNRLFVLLSVVLLFVSCQKETSLVVQRSSYLSQTKSGAEVPCITKEVALELIKPRITTFPDRWVEISKDPIPASTLLRYNIYGTEVETEEYSTYMSPSTDSWLLVVDPDFNQGGLQKQLHLFVSLRDGSITEVWIEGRIVAEWDESRYEFLTEEESRRLQSDDELPQDNNSTLWFSNNSINRWAIILSGGMNKLNNPSRFWNDCRYFYVTLTQYLGFDQGHIFCLVSDGTNPSADRRIGDEVYDNSPLDFDDDGDDDIQYSATESNLSLVFDILSELVSPGDEVLIFMTDHGSPNAQYMMWGSGVLTGTELNHELNKLGSNVTIDIVMGQCYSGAFAPFVLTAPNRSLTTSCTSSQTALTLSYSYNYFLRAWTSMLNNSYADIDGDGITTVYEIFSRTVELLPSYSPNITQTPTMGSNPDVFRMGHDLFGHNYYPTISGPSYASTAQSTTYNLSLPSILSGVPMTWSTGNNTIIINSCTDSTATVIGHLSDPRLFCYPGTDIKASFIYNGTSFTIKQAISYVWKPGYYNNVGQIMGGNGIYNIDQFDGAYGYYWWTDNPAWTILSQGSPVVYVQEGATSSPVTLNCGFFDPFGGTIAISDIVH